MKMLVTSWSKSFYTSCILDIIENNLSKTFNVCVYIFEAIHKPMPILEGIRIIVMRKVVDRCSQDKFKGQYETRIQTKLEEIAMLAHRRSHIECNGDNRFDVYDDLQKILG